MQFITAATFAVIPLLAAAYPEGATKDECARLDRIAAEIDGWLLYTRPPHEDKGERGWMAEKQRIGEWKPVPLGPAFYARWGPRARKIAWAMPNGTVGVMDADGKNYRKLCGGAGGSGKMRPNPIDFHPDGKRIIFARRGGWMHTVDIETGAVTNMGLPGPYTAEPQITADARFLVARQQQPKGSWAEQRRMVYADIAGNFERTYGGGCCAAISPDGEWMTLNHGDHKTMGIWNRDLKHVVTLDANKLVVPHGSWDNYHWSNHNDYLAMKSDAHWAGGYQGKNDVFVLKFSEKRVTRLTFNMEPEYPDLFVTRDRTTGQTDPGTTGLGKAPSVAQVGAVPGDPLAAFKPPDRTRPLTRVVATLEVRTPLPDEKDIRTREYENWLVEHVWRIKRLLLGDSPGERILVSHWAVKKRRIIPDHLVQGKTYELMLERWDERKDLHGEGRIAADKDKISLDWIQFVDVGPPRPKPKPPRKPKHTRKQPAPAPKPKPKIHIPALEDNDLDLEL